MNKEKEDKTCLFKSSPCSPCDESCKCQILEHFETDREKKEKIAWSDTIFKLQLDDLLILWLNTSSTHPLMNPPLVKVLRERIDSLGGFKLIS